MAFGTHLGMDVYFLYKVQHKNLHSHSFTLPSYIFSSNFSFVHRFPFYSYLIPFPLAKQSIVLQPVSLYFLFVLHENFNLLVRIFLRKVLFVTASNWPKLRVVDKRGNIFNL